MLSLWYVVNLSNQKLPNQGSLTHQPRKMPLLTKNRTCQKVRQVPLGWTDLTSCSSSVVSRIRGYLAVLYWVGFGKRDLVRLALVSTAPAHSNAMTTGMVCT